MGKRVNPALIGAFVLGALALTIVAVVVWGSGRFLGKAYNYVCYFPGSVNGLNIGAPVKFRGVQVGEVTEVHLRYKQVRGDPRVPVFLKLDDDRIRELGAEQGAAREVMQDYVTRGMRARLQTLSIVTGVLYVDFDLLPGSPLVLVQAEDAPVPELPTLPTPLEEMTKSVSEVLAELRTIDFERIGKGVEEVIANVNGVIGKPELRRAVAALPDLVADAKRLVSHLDERTGPVLVSARGTSEEARRAAESLRATIDDIHALVAPDSALAVGLTRTVGDLGQAARALRDLADYLERNPNSVVFGRATGGDGR
jgi:phospholipid/cholesterol/gamma-HCH transport system substrate-binding protein